MSVSFSLREPSTRQHRATVAYMARRFRSILESYLQRRVNVQLRDTHSGAEMIVEDIDNADDRDLYVTLEYDTQHNTIDAKACLYESGGRRTCRRARGLRLTDLERPEVLFSWILSRKRVPDQDHFTRTVLGTSSVHERRQEEARLIREFAQKAKKSKVKSDPWLKHCVAGVSDKSKDKDLSRAFAICVSQGQKSGYYKPGTKTQTAAGKTRGRQKAAQKGHSDVLAAYEAAKKHGRRQ